MSRNAKVSAPARPEGDEAGLAVARDAFAALDAAGVAWCLLRDGSDDVDLLVARDDLGRAGRALESIGFLEQRAWGYRPHRFFHRVGPEGRSKLDLVTDLRFGPQGHVRFLSSDEVLARRGRDAGLPRPSPADEFWTLLLHVALDKRTVDERHRRTLRRLLPAGRAVPPGLSKSAAAGLLEAVEAERWDDVPASAGVLAGAPSRMASAGTALLRRLGWRRRPLGRRGVTVAVLGSDGAGKTTLIERLVPAFPIPGRTIYMGLYKDPRRRLPPGLGLAARVALQWSRYARALYHRGRGRLVLFDRYTDDAALPPPGPRGRRDAFRRSVLARALPRPDLILVLDAPPEELFRRKGEHDPERLERSRRHYLEVAGRASNAAVIDATRPADEVAREAAARIWSAFRARS